MIDIDVDQIYLSYADEILSIASRLMSDGRPPAVALTAARELIVAHQINLRLIRKSLDDSSDLKT